ncbi:nucleoside-diphosphate kinase [Candidatus Woesearchaeota archaeon]|nr:nucleoside-diphosphate kinase [Candidatus Woesearchaeota archaeon]
MLQRTLVLLKPDCVQRMLSGRIISRFEDAGMKIVGMKFIWITPDFAKRHYAAHIQKAFYPGLEKYITEGPVIAMVLEGLHAVETVRKIVGPTEPRKAMPGTIRGDFAHHSYEYTDAKGKSIKNLIHASGSIEEAKQEIILYFKDDELHSYKSVHDIHTL